MWIPKNIFSVRRVRKQGDGYGIGQPIHNLSVHRFMCVNADVRSMLQNVA
jgi:hypothetical protein